MIDVHDCAVLMELWLGPNSSTGSQFADRAELEEAWTRLRAECMALFARGGLRPQAWWMLEAPALGLRYDDAHEQSVLYEAGVIIGEERRDLERHWREKFERGRGLDAKARRKHYRDADIPKPLIRTWSRRQARKLTATKEKPSASARGRYRGPVTALR
jgi:hypothetical protein